MSVLFPRPPTKGLNVALCGDSFYLLQRKTYCTPELYVKRSSMHIKVVMDTDSGL